MDSSADRFSTGFGADRSDLPTAGGSEESLLEPAEAVVQPGMMLAHYRLMEPLGAGGFGTVWRAEDLRLEREVALKLLTSRISGNSQAHAQLEAEARAVAALSHPGIVTLHALEMHDDRLFLVMERINGRTLAASLTSEGLSEVQVLDLSLQITEAMAAAHARGIIHRDLNPRNIMLTEEGRVKVLDFGLALRQAAWDSESTQLPKSSSGGLMGTIPYMSPEQLQEMELTAQSDIFSLGVVIYEMAVGTRPFQGKTLAELAGAILEREPSWPDHLSSALHAILSRCLAKQPEARYATCLELHQVLSECRTASEQPAMGSVAVFPFHDLSLEKDQASFCEGMAEEILHALARVEGLQVASRTSSFLYKYSNLPTQELGKRLRVRNLMTGTVAKEGNRLRVRAELSDAATGHQLWSDAFEGGCGEVFRVQEEIAQQVARALAVNLKPLAHPRPTVDLEAYEDYLRGRHYYFRYNRHGMRFALQMFQQAVEREPEYAEAWAGISNCAAFLFLYADRSDENRMQAESASERALALNPKLAEAHASRGLALSAMGRSEEAMAAFDLALAMDPNLYEAAYLKARHCFSQGNLESALDLFERAIQIRPEDCQAQLLVAQVYTRLARPAEAATARRRGVAIAEEKLRHVPDDARTRYLGANALVALGQRDKGLAWARMARNLDPDDPMLLYNVGCIHALADNPTEALDCLEQAVRAGLTDKGWLENDGDLDSLRILPRFEALLLSFGQERLDSTR
ncbi:MAG: protein kinase [Holophaga sp.]|nr:protein kinase [Holophaga sp.]